MLRLKNQRGFGALEIILVVVIVFVLIVVGYVVYQSRQPKTKTVTVAKVEKTTPAKTATTDPAVFVKDFYTEYIGGDATAAEIAKKYGTTALENYVALNKDSDPLLCGLPGKDGVTVETTKSGDFVIAKLSSDSAADTEITVGTLESDGKLYVNGVICPGQ